MTTICLKNETADATSSSGVQSWLHRLRNGPITNSTDNDIGSSSSLVVNPNEITAVAVAAATAAAAAAHRRYIDRRQVNNEDDVDEDDDENDDDDDDDNNEKMLDEDDDDDTDNSPLTDSNGAISGETTMEEETDKEFVDSNRKQQQSKHQSGRSNLKRTIKRMIQSESVEPNTSSNDNSPIWYITNPMPKVNDNGELCLTGTIRVKINRKERKASM